MYAINTTIILKKGLYFNHDYVGGCACKITSTFPIGGYATDKFGFIHHVNIDHEATARFNGPVGSVWNEQHLEKVKGEPYHMPAITLEKEAKQKINTTEETKTTKKGKIKMLLQSTKDKVMATIEPYEKYITIAAIILVIDHFILKGAMRKEITGLFQKGVNKLLEKLHNFVDSI